MTINRTHIWAVLSVLIFLVFFAWTGSIIYRSEKERDLIETCNVLKHKHSILTQIEPGYITSKIIDGECFIIEQRIYLKESDKWVKTKYVRISTTDINTAWAKWKK